MKLFTGYGAWKAQNYLLNRMTLEDLFRAYITYPGIQVYLALIVLLSGTALFFPAHAGTFAVSVLAGLFLFQIAWYLIHRFVLHGRWIFKVPFLASLWKRTHYDHHRYPNDLSVLFGGLHTTLPAVLLVAGPAGWMAGGLHAALGTVTGTLIMTCVTEFLHAGQHLAFEPRWSYWKKIKKRHLAHHFHNEQGNYGISEFFQDRMPGTFYADPAAVSRSKTARNLGYTDAMAVKYPWVRRLDGKQEDGSAVADDGTKTAGNT